MKTFRQYPLCFLALATLGGIVLEHYFMFDAFPFLVLGGSMYCFFQLKESWKQSIRLDRFRSFWLLGIALFLGMCLAQWQKNGPVYEMESLNCHEVVLLGMVDKALKTTPYGRSTELLVKAYLDTSGTFQHVEEKIQLYFSQADTNTYQRYDQLQLRAYVANIRPSSAGYAAWLQANGLRYKAYAKRAVLVSQAHSLESKFYRAQQKLAIRLDQLIDQPELAAMAKAILLGEKGDLSKEMKADFAASGLSHILAISGLHVGIIFLLLNLLLRPIHLLPHGQQLKNLAILGLLIAYMLLAGASPAVVRATLMFGAVLLYKLLRKRYHFLNLLGFSAFVQMVIEPSIIFSIGFQLSYMAVLGIVLLFPLFEKTCNTPWKWVNYAYAWIGISLAATIFTTPMVLYYFGQFPTYFILANVMVSVLAFVLVFLGFLTVLCIYIPYLSQLLAYLTEQALSCLYAIADWIAGLPGATISGFHPDERGLGYLLIELAVTALILFLPRLIYRRVMAKPESLNPKGATFVAPVN